MLGETHGPISNDVVEESVCEMGMSSTAVFELLQLSSFEENIAD